MIDKYKGMTTEQLVRTLSGSMRTALFEAIEADNVEAATGTAVALIDRGIITAGRVHEWTERGREAAALLWPEAVERATLAAEYERTSGRSSAGLSVVVLRSLLAAGAEPGVKVATLDEYNEAAGKRWPSPAEIEANHKQLDTVDAPEPRRLTSKTCCATTAGDVHARDCESDEARRQWAPRPGRAVRACCSSSVGTEHEDTCASIGARAERAVETMRHPRRTFRSQRIGPWQVDQRVSVDATFNEPGDVWRIRELVEVEDGEPYAAIELTSRVGGLPRGTTSSAVGLEWLRRIDPRPARNAPRGTIALTESLLSAARTAASTNGQFVEYDAMRAALRAAFKAVGFEVEVTPGLDTHLHEVARVPAPSGRVALATVLGLLRQFVAGCMENDEAREVRDRVRDPEQYPLMPADVRTIVADAARELGVEL